ncbi:MAG: hypothetical protein Q4E75_03305 [bacterium]|nr:hypothetical protein [bacterium]
MLDDFSLEQKIPYNILINSIKSDKLSHAYIIEANGNEKAFFFALSFVKSIFCKEHYSNLTNCKDCSQCKKIDNGEFIELKIIDTDTQWIKKSQLDELQVDFSKKSILGNKKIYIIKNAEKLNLSASNSLLKFLEEPEEGIIAILLVDNVKYLIDTIVSRCQLISLKKNKQITGSTFSKIAKYFCNDEFLDEYINSDDKRLKLIKIIEFIEFYEKEHLNTLIYINKLWHDNFKEKKEVIDAFDVMILFYKDVFNKKMSKNIEYFDDYIEKLDYICSLNSLDSIISKINVITNLKDKLIYNANVNMLIDKLIIDLGGCDNL